MKKALITFLAVILFLCNTVGYTEEIVNEATLHLEKPYRYGAEGPNAFDCSGFVFYCYKTLYDIELPRTAKEQGYNEKYQKIENIDDLRPGDTVYFNTRRDSDLCDHAGIYIGNGEFIHCSSGQRKVVISTLLKGYYNKRFSWGRRIKEVIE